MVLGCLGDLVRARIPSLKSAHASKSRVRQPSGFHARVCGGGRVDLCQSHCSVFQGSLDPADHVYFSLAVCHEERHFLWKEWVLEMNRV